MKRQAFKMYLKPGCEAEYEKRHCEIWRDLEQLLKNSGIYDYSIFWDKETNTLFAYQKVTRNEGSQDLGTNSIVQRWWKYNADIMETNADNSPISVPLEEVFYMD